MTGERRKIKVLRIITRLNIGGPALHAILLTEGMDKDIFASYLAAGETGSGEGDMGALADDKGVPVERISGLRREIGFHDITAFFKLFRLIIKLRPDIVHTHTAKAGAIGRSAAILAGVPVKIHTFHGHIFEGYFSPIKEKLFLSIERALAAFTDVILVVSEKVRGDIVHKFSICPKDKCEVMKLGLDLDKFLLTTEAPDEMRRGLGLDQDTLLVGLIGRLAPIKNHKMFLECARNVTARVPGMKLKFLVVGDGELRKDLESYCRDAGIAKDVLFTGWSKNLPELYAGLDIVALTSLNEGTPLSLIEAMASGKPVVATDVGGVGDIVSSGENGFMVGSNDVAGFSDKILELLKDKDKRKLMGLRGREFVRSAYSKEKLVSEMSGLYMRMMAGEK